MERRAHRRVSEGPNRTGLSADDWGRLGVDDFRLRSVSGLHIGVRRVQRQMVCRPESPARWIIRDATDSYSFNLSQLFLSARALDDFGVPVREVIGRFSLKVELHTRSLLLA